MDENKKAVNGAFVDSLKRNNAQIRADRADAISEMANLKYRRALEDLEIEINTMERERENMLDMSPTNATSLVLASDFKADDYVDKDLKLGVAIYNAKLKLEQGRARYEYLFGGK